MNQKQHDLIIYVFFFFSGISGLMYEVVWLRMFSLVMGVTIYATSTVVAAFMAGLAIGSYVLGRIVDRRNDTLRVYACLEFMIAVTALLVPILIRAISPILREIYAISGDGSALVTAVRTILSFIILLLPTTMMGGTLPVLTVHLINRNKSFGRNFSLLYGLNTAGAVIGVLASGFFTLGAFGQTYTVLIAALINVFVASAAYMLYRSSQNEKARSETEGIGLETHKEAVSPYPDHVRYIVLGVLALSGFTSLAYEVIWTRQLILFMRSSIYAFSFMLAVFLTGITWGSIFMRGRVDNLKRPLMLLGVFELLIGLMSVFNLHLFSPLYSNTMSILFGLSGKFLAVILIVFPITFIFGASMPVSAVCYIKGLKQTGSSVGGLYSANTVGSIIGSLLSGFFLVPYAGSAYSVIILAGINILLGALLLLSEPNAKKAFRMLTGAVIPAVLIGVVLNSAVDPFLVTTCQRIAKKSPKYKVHYYKECLEGTVTAFTIQGYKYLWINTEGMTKLCTETKLMAHLPLMAASDPKEMLVVCFGMGTTVKSAASYPGLHVTTVELVSELYDIFGFYHPDQQNLLHQERINPIEGDGRNYLLLSPKKFDVITIDPAPPIWSPGSDNLYSLEFFTLCKQHLNPDGAICVWIPVSTVLEAKSVLKTFLNVFPYVTVYQGPNGWGHYLIGVQKSVDQNEYQQRVEQYLRIPTVAKDLREYDQVAVTSDQILKLRLWFTEEVERVSQEGRLITDDRPLLQFPLWRYLLHRPSYFRLKGGPSEWFLQMK
ncbi:putative spermidine synthase with an N-terminal membrane domain [uncultured Desulfobacterium sp.]|uniref:Putative spermidine synthase with an N-terminal membrane domain n=1 Tax=uncultured Desulfobacterium sp. TaxID=201089 RepID=A0A445MUH0_9BACT|nr:putative spermidine synthase with an N-terminal membrane domain [uncultured Desulfobacterium sp.]